MRQAFFKAIEKSSSLRLARCFFFHIVKILHFGFEHLCARAFTVFASFEENGDRRQKPRAMFIVRSKNNNKFSKYSLQWFLKSLDFVISFIILCHFLSFRPWKQGQLSFIIQIQSSADDRGLCAMMWIRFATIKTSQCRTEGQSCWILFSINLEKVSSADFLLNNWQPINYVSQLSILWIWQISIDDGTSTLHLVFFLIPKTHLSQNFYL